MLSQRMVSELAGRFITMALVLRITCYRKVYSDHKVNIVMAGNWENRSTHSIGTG